MANLIEQDLTYPKISIVSPSYNQGEFIEDAIQSVIDQNYPNFEHIIIDGGSTDETIDILKKYPHLIWVSEKDKGQSDAINKGFKRASGDIIGWLNTDDYYLPNAFKLVAENFSKTSADALYGDIIFVDKHRKKTRDVKSHKPVKWLSLFYCFIPSAAFFVKRHVIQSGIMIDSNLHICMDKDLFANIFYSGHKVKYIKKYLTAFRWHENNKSLDTSDVKRIRYREGLLIFNRYSRLDVPITELTLSLYKNLMWALLPLRRLLKIVS
ncbi:glycosyltransferase family 2 protein [Dyadobacter jiangsuensis]